MRLRAYLQLGVAFILLASGSGLLHASSHMDAPLITLDDAANTTDVYAFRSSKDSVEYLTTALAVYRDRKVCSLSMLHRSASDKD